MINPTDNGLPTRGSEWFVPKFGPLRFRTFIGLLFLPYTGMVLSFSIIGSLLAARVSYDRVLAIVLIYFFGLGIAAHALDALGSKGIKPWGTVFTKTQLWVVALVSLCLRLRYCHLLYGPICSPPFCRRHSGRVFCLCLQPRVVWRQVPYGSVVCLFLGRPCRSLQAISCRQTDFHVSALILALSMALFSLVEIKASRPYKELKRRRSDLNAEEQELLQRYETLLKCISLGVMLLGGGIIDSGGSAG